MPWGGGAVLRGMECGDERGREDMGMVSGQRERGENKSVLSGV